ncbi:MAG: peptide chain release factor 2 [Planctomycetota bacterium]
MNLDGHTQKLRAALVRVNQLKESLDYEAKLRELRNVENKMTMPGFWDDQEKAQATVVEKKTLGSIVDPLDKAVELCGDLETMIELAQEDAEAFADELDGQHVQIHDVLAELEFRMMLGEEHDAKNAIVTISPGAGGVDASDWAEMLFRMYTRWAKDQGFALEEQDFQPGEEAGIKSVTFLVKGPYAYGQLRAEQGVHRLVRISQFDSQARRQTSFASLEVIPELDDEIVVAIEDKDLRVDTFRASGAGGQHVNKTDSAIRITHLPTGVVVSCQAERSQHKNRASAMKTLQSKLYQLEEAKRKEELAQFYGERGTVSWGNQIRSYVQHPYQMVKDLRTGVETSNVQGVLDGDLKPFIEAYLKGVTAKD